MPTAISMGSNPTFNGADQRAGSNVLDRSDPRLYGAQIDVGFVGRLHGQVRSEDVKGLIAQMNQDIESCHRILTRWG